MSASTTLRFCKDGSVVGVYTDLIPLHKLGTLTISRASTIEFNSTTQQWEVRWTGEESVAFSNPSRTVCNQWEVEQLNK
jgi:hypothetical protein